MTLAPDSRELMARARADLRMGVGIVLLQDNGSGAVVLSAETMTATRLQAARGLGQPVVALTARRAETLKARAYDGDLARVELPADANLPWIQALADPADDLAVPMKGPLMSRRDGDADLSRAAIRLCKESQLLPAAVVVEIPEAAALANQAGLTAVPAGAVSQAALDGSPYSPVVHARLPMAAAEKGRVHIFRPDDGGEEHYAIEIGKPDRGKPVLTRLHSACFTGDVLGSLKCDCGPQLHGALEQMGTEGEGVLLYLNQEGRGIGLANKMRAYSLQDQGFDTVEANHRLGFEDDERDFRIGAKLLARLGFSQARLLTNNPRKVNMLERCGIAVTERVPLQVGRGAHNSTYLDTKAAKSGHLL